MPYKDPEKRKEYARKWMQENVYSKGTIEPQQTPKAADVITIDVSEFDQNGREDIRAEIDRTMKAIRSDAKWCLKFPQYCPNLNQTGEGSVVNQKEEENVNKGKVKD